MCKKLESNIEEWIAATFIFSFVPNLFTLVINLVFKPEEILIVIEEMLLSGSFVISAFSLMVPSVFSLFKSVKAGKKIISFSIAIVICFLVIGAYSGLILDDDCSWVKALIVSIVSYVITTGVALSLEKNMSN